MNKKHSLESFISDIDKIVLHGETIILSNDGDCDEEYKELLSLAQLLAKADYKTKSQESMEKMMAKLNSNTQKNNELEDNELDMVAGGFHLHQMLDEKKKKG